MEMTGSVQLIKCHNSPRIERAVPITNAENINIHFLFKYFRVMRKITDPKKLTRPEIRYKFKVFGKCNTKIDFTEKNCCNIFVHSILSLVKNANCIHLNGKLAREQHEHKQYVEIDKG